MEADRIIDSEQEEEEYLLTEIEQEMRKICLSVEKLYNNASLSEANDPIEKCFINNYYYSTCLVERGLTDGLGRHEDILKTFAESLQTELDHLTVDLDRLSMTINQYKEQLSSIEANTANLFEMMKAQNESKPDKSNNNMDDVIKNIKRRFRKEKSDLKTIVSSLFPENFEIQDIIAKIVEHFLAEGTDKYVQLEDTDNVTEQIELLRRTGLFETNPFDPLQIRLVDLV